jgi:hypothetical protein
LQDGRLGEKGHKFWTVFPLFDVILFNRGAHYVADDVLGLEMKQFAQTLSKSARADQLIFWRTTASGHPNCQLSNNIPSSEELKYSDLHRYKFHWPDFKHQNELIAEIVEREAPGIISFIDIWNMTLARQDRHISSDDCLHYCLPGPPDWYVQLFVYLLSSVKQQSKIVHGHNKSRIVCKMRCHCALELEEAKTFFAQPLTKELRTDEQMPGDPQDVAALRVRRRRGAI